MTGTLEEADDHRRRPVRHSPDYVEPFRPGGPLDLEGDPPDPELVVHPKHYNSHPKGIECIEVIEDMSFNVGTAIKHLWRAGLKPDQPALRDLLKAIQYIEFEIKRTSPQQVAPDNPTVDPT